jgi:hypothetical protein
MQIYKTTNVVKYIGGEEIIIYIYIYFVSYTLLGDNITGIPTLNLTPSIGENFMREQIKFKKIELWGLVGKGASQYGPIKKVSSILFSLFIVLKFVLDISRKLSRA